MMLKVFTFVLLCLAEPTVTGENPLIAVICKRQPDLAICAGKELHAKIDAELHISHLSSDFHRSRQTDTHMVVESTTAAPALASIAKVEFTSAEERQLNRIRERNRKKEKELVEFTSAEEAELDKTTGRVAVPVLRNKTATTEEAYCARYKSHYSYYCVEKTFGKAATMKHLSVFCPTFRKNCPGKVVEVDENPFNKFAPRTSPDFPDVSKTEKEVHTEKVLDKLKKQHPCTPDCDSRVWKHCTQECKCDYQYPSVQRFCNPPPLPVFLNTCRLWYHGCSKYEQYHYSSQFVYSKAEKGKVLPGVAPGVASPGNGAQGVATQGGGGVWQSNYYGPPYGAGRYGSSTSYYPNLRYYPIQFQNPSSGR